MRITHTWANMAHTNSFLKITTVCLSITIAAVSFLALNLGSRPPLVIERSCHSKVVSLADKKHTPTEIESFLNEAISARFNSGESNPHLLSVKELKRRKIEQEAFKKQKMRQQVLVEKITFDEKAVYVQTNRLISVKDIRSALVFKIQVEFAKVSRTDQNPYGLVLTKVTEITPQKNQTKKDN